MMVSFTAPWFAIENFLVKLTKALPIAGDDVDAKREQIKSLGGDDYGDLVTIDIAEAGRLTLIYMTDPEGNIVELQKWHGDSDA